MKNLVYDNPYVSFFITGSNSDILSNDLIHNFKEDGNRIEINPLTYKEIKEIYSDYSIEDYLQYGGIPLIVYSIKDKRLAELKKLYDELYSEDINRRLTGNLSYISSKTIKEIVYNICSSSTPVSPVAIADRIAQRNIKKDFDRFKLSREPYHQVDCRVRTNGYINGLWKTLFSTSYP